MKALQFLKRLNELKIPLIQTNQAAAVLGVTTHSAGKYLETLRKQQFVEKITQGKWILKNDNFDPLQVAEFITAPKESYISLQTALFYHGMIEQVPGRIYAVTIDRSKVVNTPVGVFSFHHCHPEFFIGYKYIKSYLKIATPEKALVDYFYFSATKSRQFTQLPELVFPKRFSWKKVFLYCNSIPSRRTRSLVQAQIKAIINKKA